jgi:hypothetical protein
MLLVEWERYRYLESGGACQAGVEHNVITNQDSSSRIPTSLRPCFSPSASLAGYAASSKRISQLSAAFVEGHPSQSVEGEYHSQLSTELHAKRRADSWSEGSITPSSLTSTVPSIHLEPSSLPTAAPSLCLVPSAEPILLPRVSVTPSSIPSTVPSIDLGSCPILDLTPSASPAPGIVQLHLGHPDPCGEQGQVQGATRQVTEKKASIDRSTIILWVITNS